MKIFKTGCDFFSIKLWSKNKIRYMSMIKLLTSCDKIQHWLANLEANTILNNQWMAHWGGPRAHHSLLKILI